MACFAADSLETRVRVRVSVVSALRQASNTDQTLGCIGSVLPSAGSWMLPGERTMVGVPYRLWSQWKCPQVPTLPDSGPYPLREEIIVIAQRSPTRSLGVTRGTRGATGLEIVDVGQATPKQATPLLHRLR